ncbi:MAG TPA: OmpH family outer membrane protein, partial [bacterium]|nr:OmpH family outer membrane protein [bacterium]
LMVFSSSAFALKVGFVDIERVFSQYSGTKAAQEKLMKKKDEMEKKIEDEKKKLLAQKEDLDKKSGVLDRSNLQRQQEDLQKKVVSLSKDAEEKARQLMREEQEATGQIIEHIRAVVQQVAKEKKYDYVFEKNLILFGGDDLTFDVITKMNK